MKPSFKRLEALIIPDDSTARNLFDAARLEFMTDPGDGTSKTAPLTHQPSPIIAFIGIGPGHPLTSTRTGILALSAALNRAELPNALGMPHRPTATYCPPEIWQTLRLPNRAKPSAASELRGDITAARRLLAKAGFPDPSKIPPLTLRYFNRPAMRELAQWLQAQWKKNLALTVVLDGQDPKTYWTELARNPAPLFLNTKGASYPDPDAFFRMFEGGNEQNLGRWKNKDYDDLVSRARRRSGALGRKRLYEKAERILLGDQPAIIPLYFRDTQYLVKPFVHGILINPLTSVYFEEATYSGQ